MTDFTEGDEYDVESLPDNEMLHTGDLPEYNGSGEFVYMQDGQYVTFVVEKLRCVSAKEIKEAGDDGY